MARLSLVLGVAALAATGFRRGGYAFAAERMELKLEDVVPANAVVILAEPRLSVALGNMAEGVPIWLALTQEQRNDLADLIVDLDNLSGLTTEAVLAALSGGTLPVSEDVAQAMQNGDFQDTVAAEGKVDESKDLPLSQPLEPEAASLPAGDASADASQDSPEPASIVEPDGESKKPDAELSPAPVAGSKAKGRTPKA